MSKLLTYLRLRRHLRWPAAKFRDVQSRKLREAVAFAYENVPFYRRKYDAAGVRPDEIRTVDDIVKLPVVTKQEIRDVPYEDLVAAGLKLDDLIYHKTSSSTGRPTHVYHHPSEGALRNVIQYRGLFHLGVRPWHRIALVGPVRSAGARRTERLGILRTLYLHMDMAGEQYADELIRFKPDVVGGYPSSMYLAARELMKRGVTMPMTCVFCGGDMLEPTFAEPVRQVFGSEPLGFYGAEELGNIGWQCGQRRGYHVNADFLIIECLKDGRPAEPGEEGELVGTNLFARGMPFIRYSLDDIGSLSAEPCPCGLQTPMIRSLVGRCGDVVQLAGGRRVHFGYVTYIIAGRTELDEYRVIQERVDLFRLLYVPGKGFTPEALAGIVADLRAKLGGVTIETEARDRIIEPGAAKFKFFVSRIAG